MIEITKAGTVAFMKARNSLAVWLKRNMSIGKKTEDSENLLF